MRIMTAVLPVLLACSGESTETGATMEDDTSGAGVGAHIPTDGSYSTETEVSSNDCGGQAELAPVLTGSVSNATAESYDFLLELVDENLQFSCTLSHGAFDCTASSSTDYADWGWAAVVNFSHSMTGSWLSATEFEGQLSTATECEGSECDGLAEIAGGNFPCTVEHALSGSQP